MWSVKCWIKVLKGIYKVKFTLLMPHQIRLISWLHINIFVEYSCTTAESCFSVTRIIKCSIECQKGPHLAFALHFSIYLSHALFMQRTTLSISSRSCNYCSIGTNRAFHISMIVKENLLNVMEHFFFYSVFSRIISQKLLAFSSWKYFFFFGYFLDISTVFFLTLTQSSDIFRDLSCLQ